MKHATKLFLFMIFNIGYAMAHNVALCTVATGKYGFFVKNFIESARKNFLPDHNVKFFIFTDQVLPVEGDDITVVRWPHKKWPFSTMMRFKAYRDHAALFDSMDYVYACDVDAVFFNKIDDEILGDLVGVLHPGYYKKDIITDGAIKSLIEKNINSAICLNRNKVNCEYFAGGFYGGKTACFKNLINKCSSTISHDLELGIIAPWHDETHLNHYFLNHNPTVKLNPSYCYPEESISGPAYANVKPLTPRLVVLYKNDHLRMRNTEHFLDDREFVILIPSYNNIKYYKANLDSVFKQKYKKYRIIYIDDNSPDGTGESVTNYIKQLGKEAITTVICNQERKLALSNIYYGVVNNCLDHEVVLILDGDDELSDDHVLNKLNEEYKKNDIWFTYGNCWFSAIKQACPWSKAISEREIELNKFREWNGAATHLRTFYAWIFKKIKRENLELNGDFFKMTYDVAMFMPILEMSGYHHKFIPDVLYLYNDDNPLNDHKVNAKLQLDINRYIRQSLAKYKPITRLEYFDKIISKKDSVNAVELAAIINDFIASLKNVYLQAEVDQILNKIEYLQSEFIDKFKLADIAKAREYSYLSEYLFTNGFSK